MLITFERDLKIMTFAKSIIHVKSLIIVLLTVFLAACHSDKSISKQAQKHFEKGEYDLAIKDLTLLKDKGIEVEQTHFLLGESYRLSNRITQSLPFYQVAKAKGFADKLLPYQMAMAAKSLGNYELTKQYLTEFLSLKPNRAMQIRSEIELENLSEIPKLLSKSSPVSLIPLQGNTPQTEFDAKKIGNELVFTSSSKPSIYKNNGLPFLGIVKAPLKSDSEIGKSEMFSPNLFKENANDGSPAFTKDGKTVVFARGNTGKSKDPSPDVDLYISTKNGNTWTEPERLAISDSLAWDGSPAYSVDERTLYFSSNRRGGKGGLDLYRVPIDNSGRFGRPINLGAVINTPGDEIFPFVSGNGKLYFSSNGHPSIGGLDLFVASRNETEIVVEHLGVPMNSIGDDFAISLTDSTQGYVSSNRPGGKGDDDIYYFKSSGAEDRWWTSDPAPMVDTTVQAKIVNYQLQVKVIDALGKALDGVKVSIRKNGQSLEAEKSNPKGLLDMIPLEENDELTFKLEKEDYLTARGSFSMEGKEIPKSLLKKEVTDTTYVVQIQMDRPEIGKEISKLFEVNSIYYDLDKADIRPDAAEELDKIVQFLIDNPQMNLELGAHTDSRASTAYNLKLSQRRAESAVKYIIQRGVSNDRIKPKGYGESQLINECADGVDCPEDMHQQNRRTEFKIIKINAE
jgi:outer membrane protein OmpA-like peptidoglycan-associated protein